MKFCSILPIKNAELMYEGDCVMLLAHLSQKYPEYTKLAKSHNNYKIMDNSIIEIGESFSMEQLIEEAIKCDVQEIILPDEFNNGYKTIEKVKESIKWIKSNDYLDRFKLMAVCHGRNIVELWSCFNELRNIEEIDVIGIPKITSTWLKDRVREAALMKQFTNKEIHLLGCWNNLNELKSPYKTEIRSMDTCLPALLSIYGMKTFDDRNGLKINLEKDRIKLKNYREIIKNIKNVI